MDVKEAKGFLKGAATVYLVVAMLGGFGMKTAIPALNPLGMAYVGLTWPIAMGCVATHSPCNAIPPERYARWLFTFSEQPGDHQ